MKRKRDSVDHLDLPSKCMDEGPFVLLTGLIPGVALLGRPGTAADQCIINVAPDVDSPQRLLVAPRRALFERMTQQQKLDLVEDLVSNDAYEQWLGQDSKTIGDRLEKILEWDRS